jgi:hypothetical protein
VSRLDFTEYRRLALAGGASEAEVDQAIAEMRRLDAGRCPKCAGPISRKVDPRQAGPTSFHGTWFNYRCPCGYMSDRSEPS